MVAKEWRDARWKLLIGVLALLLIVSVFPRPYEKILDDIEQQAEMMELQLKSPELFQGPPVGPPGEELGQGYSEEQMRKDMRDQMQRMKSPAFAVMTARSEIIGIHQAGSYAVMAGLAGLLGVALVSGEVSRGTIFLLLSKPLGRIRLLATKYSICVVILLLAALIGGVGAIFSAYARGYPPESIAIGYLLTTSLLFWLGSLFVLTVALLASVVFRNVISSIIATALSLYAVYAAPDLLMSVVESWLWRERGQPPNPSVMDDWYEFFERFRLLNYWGAGNPYTGEWAGWWVTMQNALVLGVAVAVPLLAALWLFNRKAY